MRDQGSAFITEGSSVAVLLELAKQPHANLNQTKLPPTHFCQKTAFFKLFAQNGPSENCGTGVAIGIDGKQVEGSGKAATFNRLNKIS